LFTQKINTIIARILSIWCFHYQRLIILQIQWLLMQ
jgi:hypothetical protein